MMDSVRTLNILQIIFFLFMACGSTDSGIGDPIISTSMVHPLASLTRRISPVSSSGCPGGLTFCQTPQSLRLAYGIDPLIQKGFTGQGQTVIDVVSFGSPTLQQDMAVFDQTFNLPPINVQVISPLNIPKQGSLQDQEGWAQETELDVQVIHALAPGAKIIVLQSPVSETQGTVGLPEYRQLEQYIIDHRLGNIVSQSWGASELTLQDTQGLQEMQKWDVLLRQGTISNHITYFSSSGDTGAADAIDVRNTLGKVPTTSFAPDSPWVTSVGGTRLQRRGSTFIETAWSDHGDSAGSGGGFSRFFQMPAYQKLLPVAVQQGFANRRGVPDVSADADPATGMAIYEQGQWTLGGGTSASAPVWAAVQAIANQVAGHPLGFINPGLYKLAISATYQQDFHDITQGNNSNLEAGVRGYSATVGWDPVTGLGSPNAERLIPDLIAALR
jgi:subtilase family serine protease